MAVTGFNLSQNADTLKDVGLLFRIGDFYPSGGNVILTIEKEGDISPFGYTTAIVGKFYPYLMCTRGKDASFNGILI
jgi:hypothetical protein